MKRAFSISREPLIAAFLAVIAGIAYEHGVMAASPNSYRINSASVAGYDSASSVSANPGVVQPARDSLGAGGKQPHQSAGAVDSAEKVAANSMQHAVASETEHGASQPQAADIGATLGGNLTKIVGARGGPYLVIADIYVPEGKTVRIEPGAVLLFKNFTGIHVEGKLLAEGTVEKPIVFSSEFDHSFNPGSPLHANPFDWDGIYIHEGGLGSSLAHCTIRYSVYGINSLTKYIRLDSVSFLENGRSDCIIEGQRRNVTQGSLSYALTLDDARKDGVPVHILMDPKAKKRNVLKYGGLTVLTGGCFMAVFSALRFQTDQTRLTALSDKTFVDEKSNIYVNSEADWRKAQSDRNVDLGLIVVGILGAAAGAVGFGVSFTF